MGVDFRTADAIDIEHDLAIVQQQHVTRSNVFRQILVSDAYGIDRARFWVERRVEREGLPLLQHDLPLAKALDADLRSAEVEENANAYVANPCGLAHQGEAAPAIVDGAVRGVQPHHVDALTHHSDHHAQVIGRRPYGGDYLRTSQHKFVSMRFALGISPARAIF